MRGLSLWMCSQVSPMRSSAPGAKFSTSTSQCLISRSRISLPFGCLRVDRDRALVAVEHREIEAVGALHVAQLAARDVADARPLDLDAVGAHVGEKLRAGRARLHVGEVEDAHAVERLAGLAVGLGRRLRQAVAVLPSRPASSRLATLRRSFLRRLGLLRSLAAVSLRFAAFCLLLGHRLSRSSLRVPGDLVRRDAGMTLRVISSSARFAD